MIRINGIDKESTVHQESSMNHGMYHMTANNHLYQPQLSTQFEFVITNLDGLTHLSTGEEIANAQEILRLAVVECDVPHFSQTPITERRANSVQKFAGTPEFNEGRITVRDWIGADTKSILMSWQNQSYDVRTDKVGLVSDYQRDCWLIEYTPDWQEVRKWILQGCWISALTEPSYNHSESSGTREISATIQYNRAILDIPD